MKRMSYYLIDRVLGHLFGLGYFGPPLVIGVALSRYNPSPSGTGLDEPSPADNYSRVATYASWWTLDELQDEEDASMMHNSTAIVFNEASGDWGEITHFALFDSANYGVGNMLFFGELLVPKVITTGCIVRFEASGLHTTMM